MHPGTTFAAQLQYSNKIASEAQCHFKEDKYHICESVLPPAVGIFSCTSSRMVVNISTTLGYESNECKVCYSLQRKYKHMQK